MLQQYHFPWSLRQSMWFFFEILSHLSNRFLCWLILLCLPWPVHRSPHPCISFQLVVGSAKVAGDGSSDLGTSTSGAQLHVPCCIMGRAHIWSAYTKISYVRISGRRSMVLNQCSPGWSKTRGACYKCRLATSLPWLWEEVEFCKRQTCQVNF